jgi:L-2-hydroxyglutarate oxidase LhgO
MTRPDVLIVGGGVIGCAVTYELAEERLRVTLLAEKDTSARLSRRVEWRRFQRISDRC